MPLPPSQQQLSAVIAREYDAAGELLELLETEQAAISGDPEALEGIVARKQAQLQQLEALDSERNRIVGEAGYPGDPDGMSACLKQFNSSSLDASWRQLLDRLSQCRRQNEINGAAIEASRHNLRQALEILVGQDPAATTYASDGRASNDRSGRPIAKA